MTANPIDLAIVDNADVAKSDVRGLVKSRVRLRMATVSEVRSTNLVGQYGIYVDSINSNLDLDVTDTTTADDGATCIVSNDGYRFKLISAAGTLLVASNLSDVASPATAFGNIKQNASTSATGVVELATDAEAITGTDTARVPSVASMTAAISDRVAALVNSAPATLDTLKELADALGDDPNFATTVTTSLAGKQAHDADLDALAALSSNGLIARTGAGTVSTRTLTAPAAGISVSNGDGVSGNPTLALADDLAALEALSGTNTIYYRSAANTWSAVTVSANLGFSAGTLGSALGSAATKNTGTSGNNVPLLDGANYWSGVNTINLSAGTLPAPPSGAVLHIGHADATSTMAMVEAFGATPMISYRRCQGTLASPTALTTTIALGSFNWYGHDGVAYTSTSRAGISARAAENWAAGAHGTYFTINVTANGTTTSTERARFNNSGGVGFGSTVDPGDVGGAIFAGLVQTGGGSRVSSDFSKTSDTSLASITGLSATLQAGITYTFEIELFVDAGALGGHKYDLGGGTATATAVIANITSIDDTSNLNVITSRQTSLTGSVGQDGGTTYYTRIVGTITVNAAGTFIPRFAQNASSGTASTVKAGSFMRVWRVA